MKLKTMLFALAMLLTCGTASAQTQEELAQMAQMIPQLQVDPAVRKGTLPNGLTYYIRHNAWPEKRAYFYIAQKVGSMQEEDNQRGLAHFLEHMCFNGTTNFPGNKLKTYLESNGVKFGADLNAYTSFDETVYNIDNVNTANEKLLDSCLLILHDWSHDLLLEDEEIDKERGVINEEWRMRRSASQRLYEAALPDVYPGSKYANRMPIGTMDVVMNFPYEDLRSYYRKWYRPDLQAIVVVGDFDVDQMEQKIKTTFADIKAPDNPAEREYFPVPDNDQPLVSIHADKELPYSQIMLFKKHDAMPDVLKNTSLYYAQNYITSAISGMFSMRIQEILQKENPPFMTAAMDDDDFFVAKTKDALMGYTVFKDNGQDDALAALYREMLRASRHGFTVTEYERYKDEYLSRLEEMYSQRDKTKSSSYVNECVSNFKDNEPMPGIDWEYQTMKAMVPQIPLEAINQALQQLCPETDSNLVVLMFAPEKADVTLPTKDELLNVLHSVQAETIEPYAEEVNTDPLISENLKGAKAKKIEDGMYDSKTITLKNGVKIHVKKTDFKPNSISMDAVSWGGTSLYSDANFLNASAADDIAFGGWGNFSKTDLQKKLSGIQASARPYVGQNGEGITGSCVTKDLETMLQLTYLNFTAPRRDDQAYSAWTTRTKDELKNADMQPTMALQDTLMAVIYGNNIRAQRTKVEDIDRLSYDDMLKFYKERFADGNDFEFFFVGDIDLETALPLFEKYLGSLPTLKGEEKYNKQNLTKFVDGTETHIFEKAQETPNSVTIFLAHAHIPYNQRNNLTVSMLQQLMSMLYIESVREDEGGAYGVPVQGGMSDVPEEIAQILIQLPTAPEKRERMTEIVKQGIDDMCQNGPKAEDLVKVKEYMHRRHQERLKDNSYWMGRLQDYYRDNREFVNDYDKTVDEITAADIQEMAKTIFKSGNFLTVGMTSPAE